MKIPVHRDSQFKVAELKKSAQGLWLGKVQVLRDQNSAPYSGGFQGHQGLNQGRHPAGGNKGHRKPKLIAGTQAREDGGKDFFVLGRVVDQKLGQVFVQSRVGPVDETCAESLFQVGVFLAHDPKIR